MDAPGEPGSRRRDRGIPVRALLAIGAAVVLAHALVLRALPSSPLSVTPVNRAMVTRTVLPERPAVVPAPAPKPAVAPAPKPVARPAPPKPRPKPAPAPTVAAAPVEAVAAATVPAETPAEQTALPAAATPAEPAASASASPSAPASTAEAPRPLPPRETPVGASILAFPASGRLQYEVVGEVKRLSYSARAELLWMQDGANYDAVLEVRAFLLGAFTQMSSGQVTAEGLAPLRFADKRRNEVAAHFERDKGKVTFSANTPDAPLLSGAQDRLSVIFQLAAMLGGEPAKFPPATTITLQIVGPRDAELWLFTVEGEETLALPGGPLPAVKVIRNPRREFDQRIEVWFAPSLGYLPARVKVTQANGDFVDQRYVGVEKP